MTIECWQTAPRTESDTRHPLKQLAGGSSKHLQFIFPQWSAVSLCELTGMADGYHYPEWALPAPNQLIRGRHDRNELKNLPRLARYDGASGDLEAIAKSYLDRATALNWDDDTLKFHFTQALDGKARSYYYSLNSANRMSFDEIIDSMANRFEKAPPNRIAAMASLSHVAQESDEDVHEFVMRVRKLCRIAYPDEEELVVIASVAAGLHPSYREYDIKDLYRKVERGEYTNADELVTDLKNFIRVAQHYGPSSHKSPKSVKFSEEQLSSPTTVRRMTSAYAGGRLSTGRKPEAMTSPDRTNTSLEKGTQQVLERVCLTLDKLTNQVTQKFDNITDQMVSRLDKVAENFDKMVTTCGTLAQSVEGVKGEVKEIRNEVQKISAKTEDLATEILKLKLSNSTFREYGYRRSRSPSPGGRGSPLSGGCFNCGGAHFKRDCPKTQGNGKGVSVGAGPQLRPAPSTNQQ